jgi:hypothetical protein
MNKNRIRTLALNATLALVYLSLGFAAFLLFFASQL